MSEALPENMRNSTRLLSTVVVFMATAWDAVWNLRLTGFRLVDEDAAIYWFAAREFAGFRFREPFFYGQAYHHLGESIIAAPVVAAGVPPWIVLPAVSVLVGFAAWAVLGCIAWRRGAVGLGLILLGAPLFLPPGYAILQQRFFGLGLLLVALGLRVACATPSRGSAVLAGFLIALGCRLVPNSALLAAVGVAWLATSFPGMRWAWVSCGAASGVGLHFLGELFYIRDPSWAVHPAPAVQLGWSPLIDGLANLPRHLGRVTPGVLVHPALTLAAILLVGVFAARRRAWTVAVPAVVLLAVVIGAMSVSKVHEGTPSVFFALERMYLGLPLALGLLAIATVEARLWRGGATPRAMLVAVVAVLVAAGWRWSTLEHAVAAEHARRGVVLDVGDVPGAVRSCEVAEAAARAEGTDLVVYLAHRTLAYSCGALAYGRITTIFPKYERRTWIMREEATRQRQVLVIPDVDPESICGAVRERLEDATCGLGLGGVVVVRLRPTSAVDFARSLGIPVREF